MTALATVIMVTYRSSASAPNALAQLLELCAAEARLDVSVVDNSPASEDSEFVAARFGDSSRIGVIKRADNPGFAAGCNIAARKSETEWLLLLNPDLHATEAIIAGVVEELECAAADVAAIAFTQDTQGKRHCGIAANKFGWFLDRNVGSSSRLLGPSGGAAAIRRDVFQRLGGLEEGLFAWGEDADFAFRLVRAGMITRESDVCFGHEGGHSVKGSRELSMRKARLLLRNRFIVASRHYSSWLKVLFLLFATAVFLARVPRWLSAGFLRAMTSTFVAGVTELVKSRPTMSPASISRKDL